MAHDMGMVSLCLVALWAPAVEVRASSEGDQALERLCKRLDECYPEVYSCEIRASLLADFLARNGLPRGLCPLLGITCGPGKTSSFELTLPPRAPSFLSGQLKRLMPTDKRPAGARQGAVDAYLNSILSIANPRALAANLLEVRRRARKLTVSEHRADGKRFEVIDFADLCMPVSMLGHLLRMKLWVGTDGLIHRATLYTSLHGMLDMRVEHGDLEDTSGRRLKVPVRIRILPILSEHPPTPTNPLVIEFLNGRIPRKGSDTVQGNKANERAEK